MITETEFKDFVEENENGWSYLQIETTELFGGWFLSYKLGHSVSRYNEICVICKLNYTQENTKINLELDDIMTLGFEYSTLSYDSFLEALIQCKIESVSKLKVLSEGLTSLYKDVNVNMTNK